MAEHAVETGSTHGHDADRRRGWLAVLARASTAELERAWHGLVPTPRYRMLRMAETGLVMIRGRIGGGGSPFNLGEMTMTRAAVQILDDRGEPIATGLGHVAGRVERKAELVALFDAMLQDPRRGPALAQGLIASLAARQAEQKAAEAGRIATSRVEFLTMVRGE